MTKAKEHLNNAALSGLLFFCVFFAISLFLNDQIAQSVLFFICAPCFTKAFFTAHLSSPSRKKQLLIACTALWVCIDITLVSHSLSEFSLVLYWLFPLAAATLILIGVKFGSILSLSALCLSFPLTPENNSSSFFFQALSFALFLSLFSVLLTYLTKLEKDLKLATRTDPLTGCTSIPYFKHKLKSATELQRRYKDQVTCLSLSSECMIKKYRDHEQWLVEVSQICQSRIRQTDVICNYTNKRFLILLPNTDLDNAHNLGKDLIQACEAYKFSYLAKQDEPAKFHYELSSYSDNDDWESWLSQLTR